MPAYDPNKSSLVVNGFNVSGFSDEDIEIKYNDEDDVKEHVGIKGEHSFTENQDKSGTITFSIKNSATGNLAFLDALQKSRASFPVMFKSWGGVSFTAAADEARIKNRPTKTFGKEETMTGFVIACAELTTASL